MIYDKMGLTLNLSSQFEQLSDKIFETTGKTLGVNTLKRLFGKLPDVNTSDTTLNIIAEFLGYQNWKTLKKISENGNSKIDGIHTTIYLKDMMAGQSIKVNYEPNRELLLKVREDKRCLVTSAKGCKIHKGDILDLIDIVTDYPLTVHQVEREGAFIGSYIGGIEGGVKRIEVVDSAR
ncbi:MAG: hypothetical protein LKG25_07575 [Prevotella sp.]|nr:hypothetical protein [Prevotella sp.]MCI1282441.1 hypothetical protein [Prevotella sp.]